ncbi:GNAT family N-acetyltransferase [Labilibaculum sp.]|uniref:GNAT family N-acetyltransferase n=1 Tax=Labilibaculum sp. TaxID=2060723 RepID=UPI002AA686FC|nr:GNAT family N-acetyltransferase [Labilibaculum sp.]
MQIISIRENPEYKDMAIEYFQRSWKTVLPIIYQDCISHSISSQNPLPQWYLMVKDDEIIGCAGLITNDFISRMDLYPWICALFIEKNHRGNAYGSQLMEKAKVDAKKAGFNYIYLCTDHIEYYEKYGFKYVGQGYHPWDEESRIYELKL